MTVRSGWRFGTGDRIVTGLGALRRLGGDGGFEWFLAWDERLCAPVVVKLPVPHLVGDPGALATLAAELDALRRLEHPVIGRSFGADLDGSRPYLLLEYVESARLASVLRSGGRLRPSGVVAVARHLCSALGFLAGQGWVHGSVSSRSIHVGEGTRLIDLSAARRVGTPMRMPGALAPARPIAPEASDPSSVADPAADIWALGVVLVEALSGRLLGPAELAAAPGRVAWLPHDTAEELADVVRRCLESRPADRPTAADLDGVLGLVAERGARDRPRSRVGRPDVVWPVD